MLLPTGMIAVLNGSVDDGWGGMLGWMWVMCALDHDHPDLHHQGGPARALLLGGDGGDRAALSRHPHRLRHGHRPPRRPRLLKRDAGQTPRLVVSHRTVVVDSGHGTAGVEWDDLVRVGGDPRQVVPRGAPSERVVQPARRAQRWRASATARSTPRPVTRSATTTSSRGTRSRRAATWSSTPTSSSRSCPSATKSIDLEEFVDLADIDPVYFDTAYHLAPDRSAEAVRAARPGDGGQRQGRDRAVRDAQQAVHGGDPRRGRAARDVDDGVRRRGARSGRHRRAAGRSTSSR